MIQQRTLLTISVFAIGQTSGRFKFRMSHPLLSEQGQDQREKLGLWNSRHLLIIDNIRRNMRTQKSSRKLRKTENQSGDLLGLVASRAPLLARLSAVYFGWAV
ncbi:hypothetical protein B0H15DRAFT_950446 [Mycena belliarum]|uniref:Uncharacterized protein n=1 Tax=Mycena belliarum TaxID=1033014 RepID=A0AAD6U113_9AGAR|nr:hypothetical protein B0H15DRAFT_950446 [Mycena belliae]